MAKLRHSYHFQPADHPATLVLVIAHFTVRSYQRRLEEMATTDKLTGASNRQVIDMIFNHVDKTAKRRGEAISLITLDIDHFKQINDTYGHQGEDTVIYQLAQIIRQHIREADTLCRWGGEEFLLLLNDCALEDACERAEIIRKAVKNSAIRFGWEDTHITISLGVAQHRTGEELASLIHRADNALYEATGQGRDRVQTAE